MAGDLRYADNPDLRPKPGQRWSNTSATHTLFPYLADGDLKEAVNVAIFLERPLLLQGEPGCGKTKLALAVAYEFAQSAGNGVWPYFEWPIKSTSRAQDGLYTYDAVGRLRNAQLAQIGQEEAKDVSEFVQRGPLGKAFRTAKEIEASNAAPRPIVLIDEIDKADIDFPNDLLWELEEGYFRIPELANQEFRATPKPIIFITSNREKDLPPAFLRRCVHHYIDFPKPERLQDIVSAHITDLETSLIEGMVERFSKLREAMVDNPLSGKRVSTGELIQWAHVLQAHIEDPEEILKRLKEKELPYPSVLLKDVMQLKTFAGKEEKK